MQDGFIKVFKNIHAFKKESKLYSWIYRIATNESITFLNRKAKRLQLTYEGLQTHLVSHLSEDPYFDGDEALLKLHRAVALLPQRQQQVFQMKYFQDLTYNEISEILEVSEGALNLTQLSKKEMPVIMPAHKSASTPIVISVIFISWIYF